MPLFILDRITKEKKEEKVMGNFFLSLLYKNPLFSFLLLPFIAKTPFFSFLYGFLQNLSFTKHKIPRFVKKYEIDPNEFEKKISSFSSFNDFFIRKLKKETRPVAQGENLAVIPADGRYRFYPKVEEKIRIKGKSFSLKKLIGNQISFHDYLEGSLVLGRLAPPDYHRFHFPVSCLPGQAKLINGYLYSVSPIAMAYNAEILTENKRFITILHTENFGDVLFLEVGATNVGSIHQTYTPLEPQEKGNEKGYFSFGASLIAILFPKDRFKLSEDLLSLSSQDLEVLCLMGQPLGTFLKNRS